MSRVLDVRNLNKDYPTFSLKDVSFHIDEGRIMGFIGRNGAGKTTTLKSILNMVHPKSGEITYFGLPLMENERKIKELTGFASGGVDYYQRKKVKDIVSVTKLFYDNWDDNLYRNYMDLFSIDENKKVMELSEGMKVKMNLSIALSHNAKLLILDEPTSGLDPVSRDDLLEVFLDLAAKGTSILFSTHITSDLEKCADDITYIKKGEIIASTTVDEFKNSYRLVKADNDNDSRFVGVTRSRDGLYALISAKYENEFENATIPDMETIMVHLEKEVKE